MTRNLLQVSGLTKTFSDQANFWSSKPSVTTALQNVSFEIAKGETFGVVGESGCGKSTLARCVTRLLDATAGTIHFQNQDITQLQGSELRGLRRKMQIVFQDPMGSLNPRMKVGDLLQEPLDIHQILSSKKDRQDRVSQLLEIVGLRAEMKNRYPHEFSGGQRQRIGIARALAVEPELLVCDEPVSALDVSVQAQIIYLLKDLQQKLGLTYLFIAHDLKVVEHISNRVAVMQSGQVVETATVSELFSNPQHVYTKTLLSTIPRLQYGSVSKETVR